MSVDDRAVAWRERRRKWAELNRAERGRVALLIAGDRVKPAAHDHADRGPTGEAAVSRPVEDASYRGLTLPGRRVMSHPIDVIHHIGQITDEAYAAGCRLRGALEGSWPADRVTARLGYMSEPGPWDADPDLEVSEEDRDATRKRCAADVDAAREIVGARAWVQVAHVCAGGAVTSPEALAVLRAGLLALAAAWKA